MTYLLAITLFGGVTCRTLQKMYSFQPFVEQSGWTMEDCIKVGPIFIWEHKGEGRRGQLMIVSMPPPPPPLPPFYNQSSIEEWFRSSSSSASMQLPKVGYLHVFTSHTCTHDFYTAGPVFKGSCIESYGRGLS